MTYLPIFNDHFLAKTWSASSPRLLLTSSLRLSLILLLITNTLPGPRASEVTTLWRYTNIFIIIIILPQSTDQTSGLAGTTLTSPTTRKGTN